MESLLFILPAAFALLALFIPKSGIKAFSILASVAVFGVLAVLFANYNAETGEIHYIINDQFLGKINLAFGYDAISLMMIGLTTALVPLILISNFKNEIANNRTFVSMVFFMQFGLIGVFLALDAVFFYVFWEITLIPIFIIAYLFGAPERKAALIKFFIYTFVGSLAMLA
ncbi:MAG: proton-conducting transporter membrane subunit, partial [Fluviicola sp.]